MTKLHLEGEPKSNLDSILGTFLQVYPHVTIWFPTTKPFVFLYLVGSREPQSFSPKRIDDEMMKEANSVDPIGYFVKPVAYEDIESTIESALKKNIRKTVRRKKHAV